MLENMNHRLFLLINAGKEPPDWLLLVAYFLAQKLILIIPFMMATMWCLARNRKWVFNAAMALIVASLLSKIIGLLYPHARPFAMGVGEQFLAHAANPSFPSNHAIGMFTFAIAFLFWGRLRTGIIMLVLSLSVGWSRIYLGIHWPFDILGGALVAALSCWFAQYLWSRGGESLFTSVHRLYQLLFFIPINRGWVKA